MTTLATILAGRTPSADGDAGYQLADDWMQGRTAFGGLSSAVALHHAMAIVPDLPPLRSALIAFVGPLAGAVTARARVLRRGRNAVFVAAQLLSGDDVGFDATFVFVAARASRIAQAAAPPPPGPAPEAGVATRRGPAGMFLQNFELLPDQGGDDPPRWLRWIRLADRAGLHPMIELLAIADALPPAAMRLAGGPAPISSMTWQLNLLTDAPATDDGWWLTASENQAAVDGCSSQQMAIWNRAGDRVASGMQSVALFV